MPKHPDIARHHPTLAKYVAGTGCDCEDPHTGEPVDADDLDLEQRCVWCRLELEAGAVETMLDGVYGERNRLVCALTRIFASYLAPHPEEDTDWDDDWRWIVFVELPTGQASWHIHVSELPLFDHVPRRASYRWDGHTTEEKYARLAALRRSEAHSPLMVNDPPGGPTERHVQRITFEVPRKDLVNMLHPLRLEREETE